MHGAAWYSSRIRLVVITGTEGGLHYADSVFVFRAGSYGEAFQRALALGRKSEESYKNEVGDVVAWKLKEILTLDLIKASDLDGAEVAYETSDVPSAEVISLSTVFEPEKSEPRESF